jgi:hypothetical protein
MNRKQRMQNRATALELYYKNPPKYVCPECGEKTRVGHLVPASGFMGSFWTCGKLYDADGRRINGAY